MTERVNDGGGQSRRATEIPGENVPLLSWASSTFQNAVAGAGFHHRRSLVRQYTGEASFGIECEDLHLSQADTFSTAKDQDSLGGSSTRGTRSPSMSPPSSPWLRKPLSVLRKDAHHHIEENEAFLSMPSEADKLPPNVELPRHLTLFDLLCVGVGSTIGSGIYVLCGLIARDYAGPATFVSWGIAGFAACVSGCCYAELAGKLPVAGSVYAYAYNTMGELPAVVAAACLTLEYVGSASAVARSWGDKVVEYAHGQLGGGEWVVRYLQPGMGVNPAAFLVSATATGLLLKGVKESKGVTNFFTSVNVLLVAFMAIGGMFLMDRNNLSPLVPPEYGVAGVFRGATSSFFGYIGYDEVCCLAGEAINAKKNMPRAVMLTLTLVTCLYMFAALALVGMQPYTEISRTSGFPVAFGWNGVKWASQLTAFGEVFALPSVVLITLMAQPRLQFALAQDGLLPKFLGEVNEAGNLWNGAFVAGTVMTTIATFVPFNYLDDLISSGILVAFSMTNWSVISLRHESPENKPFLLEKLLGAFNILAFSSCLLLSRCLGSWFGNCLAAAFCGATLFTVILVRYWCPQVLSLCRSESESSLVPLDSNQEDPGYSFEAPFVPFLPCLGIFMNWYLITQLEALGICLLLLYIGLAVAFYFMYGVKNSVGNTKGWDSSCRSPSISMH